MKRDALYLAHILECIERVRSYAGGSRELFLTDTKTQDAVLRNLHVLAESTQKLSTPLKARHPEVSWPTISAFRNVIVHDYLGIDPEVVWTIIERDLPDLERKIAAIRDEVARED